MRPRLLIRLVDVTDGDVGDHYVGLPFTFLYGINENLMFDEPAFN